MRGGSDRKWRKNLEFDQQHQKVPKAGRRRCHMENMTPKWENVIKTWRTYSKSSDGTLPSFRQIDWTEIDFTLSETTLHYSNVQNDVKVSRYYQIVWNHLRLWFFVRNDVSLWLVTVWDDVKLLCWSEKTPNWREQQSKTILNYDGTFIMIQTTSILVWNDGKLLQAGLELH